MPSHNPNGLTAAEVKKRVDAGKINSVDQQSSRPLKDILKANLLTRFNALLGILFIIVLIVGSPADALFGLVIIINSAIGIIQELRAKRTLDRLAILHAPFARVIRDDKIHKISLSQVVEGDVLELQAGDQVPADGVVLSSQGLEVNEALLTGESDTIDKQEGMKVLSGSMALAGRGLMRATKVGKEAYAYKISRRIKKYSRVRSELIEGTNKLLGYISWIILIVAPVLVWGQIVNSGNSWQEAMVRSAAAIVGMVPEGLVLLTSMAFLIATLVLARRKVLVQQLPAVESLARVDVICLDKTGTLTEDKIIFKELIILDKKQQSKIDSVLATFSNNPGTTTMRAVNERFKDGVLKAASSIPFSSARKWSAIAFGSSDSWILGAPDVLLSEDYYKDARQQSTEIADSGERVLCLLRSQDSLAKQKLPNNMKPVALIVLSEKIRRDAKKTLGFFSEQGVSLKIISGDSPRTVAAVARKIGVEFDEPFDARKLPIGSRELAATMRDNNIFGRVTPEQKLAMVKALQDSGRVVAMTGDGVNDAMALKEADVGIAMASGAQATKAAAELVLLDNRFSHMPSVLAEGRRVIANIERVANLFLTKNVYSLLLALSVTLMALPYPFLPRHLTIISSLTIGIPAFFLALAPNSQRYKPGFLSRVLRFAIPTGSLIALLVIISYFTVLNDGGSPALSSTVASSIVLIVGVWVLFCLARPLNIWKIGLIISMAAVFIFLINFSFSQKFLDYSLDGAYLMLTMGFGLLGAILVEVIWRYDQRIKAAR